ncbi:hypothetical protein ACFW2D_17545 [Streptomyces sp. NPDC058914]|uniref:hypothetical protein n=1 Tax=Streptomyces sp. NPDC058914 TaxID=3346671 RepID=UPI0036CFAECF
MARYDATDALDELFEDGGYAAGAGSAVSARTEAILDGPSPSDSIDAVLRLADGLPGLDEVREVAEGDVSELTEQELQQKERTEAVIRTAMATGDASVWVVAQGLERVAKGKWWRRTHRTLAAYVEDTIGRSAVYARQLRNNAPLALETAERTGTVPHPSHVKETKKTEKQYGRDAAVTLYEVVRDVSAELGERPTASSLQAVHQRLPEQLPGLPEQQRAVIEETTRHVLGVDGASIEALPFEAKSNTDASIEAPDGMPEGESSAVGAATRAGDDDIQDAEVVPEYLAALQDALKKLNLLDRAVTKDVYAQAAADPEGAEEYRKVREAIIRRATAIRNKALHAPTPPAADG